MDFYPSLSSRDDDRAKALAEEMLPAVKALVRERGANNSMLTFMLAVAYLAEAINDTSWDDGTEVGSAEF